MTTSDDDKLIIQARHTLDAAADNLDTLTTAKLRAARLRALDAGRTRLAGRGWWIGLGGAVTAGLVAIAVGGYLFLRPPAPAPLAVAAADDFELLLRGDAPDFYKELEFYVWLAERQDA